MNHCWDGRMTNAHFSSLCVCIGLASFQQLVLPRNIISWKEGCPLQWFITAALSGYMPSAYEDSKYGLNSSRQNNTLPNFLSCSVLFQTANPTIWPIQQWQSKFNFSVGRWYYLPIYFFCYTPLQVLQVQGLKTQRHPTWFFTKRGLRYVGGYLLITNCDLSTTCLTPRVWHVTLSDGQSKQTQRPIQANPTTNPSQPNDKVSKLNATQHKKRGSQVCMYLEEATY